ncbi:serine hydrolase domain-containing protein [Kitasatospora aureofaciens]|uniref:serine hydrolase n=1 Tax=Kitasatospora aureofaciens TaxID=1894 RepID=UPI001D906CC7|nr:serine hydrolase domain-containing protein [Kitasatospora aureofaciens]HJD80879.1 beta-lactamase family protein [Kitasatospora aureofaciens]
MSKDMYREFSDNVDREVAKLVDRTNRDAARVVDRALGRTGTGGAFDTAHWQRRLDDLLTTHHIPGAVLAVLTGGEIHEVASGILHTGTGVETTTDSVFQIGSVSKGYTAALVLALADAGRLDLDRPVVEILPDFALADADPRHRPSHERRGRRTEGPRGPVPRTEREVRRGRHASVRPVRQPPGGRQPFTGRYEREGFLMTITAHEGDGEGVLDLRYEGRGGLAGTFDPLVWHLTPVSDSPAKTVFAGRRNDRDAWIPVVFYPLPDGTRYVHFGVRATAKSA